MLIQEVVNICVERFGMGCGLLVCWVCFENVLEKFACGRLTTFGHPVARYDTVSVGTPDTVDEDRLFRHDQVAGRCACHGCESAERLCLIVLWDVSIELVVCELDLGPNCSDPACVGVDYTGTNGDTSWQVEFLCGFLTESTSKLACREIFSILFPLAFVIVGKKIGLLLRQHHQDA